MRRSQRKNEPFGIASADAIACRMLLQRLQAAQALSEGQQPATGALNYTQPTEEAQYASLN